MDGILTIVVAIVVMICFDLAAITWGKDSRSLDGTGYDPRYDWHSR